MAYLASSSQPLRMASCSEMTDDDPLERVLPWQLNKILRAIRPENEAKDCFVNFTHTGNKRESPLEGKYIRVYRS
jgi:hypothetical protein